MIKYKVKNMEIKFIAYTSNLVYKLRLKTFNIGFLTFIFVFILLITPYSFQCFIYFYI